MRQKTGLTKRCLTCFKEFYALRKDIKIGKGIYCSKKCYWISKKGKDTWNKGITGYKSPAISSALKSRIISDEWKEKMRLSHIGIFIGEHNPMWKGGITSLNQAVRNSAEYKFWRESVFKRDLYTCQICGIRSQAGQSVTLHADHIKPFAYFIDLRFELANGRTLCRDCHKLTDIYGGRAKRYA
jgi:hypothetical protein